MESKGQGQHPGAVEALASVTPKLGERLQQMPGMTSELSFPEECSASNS